MWKSRALWSIIFNDISYHSWATKRTRRKKSGRHVVPAYCGLQSTTLKSSGTCHQGAFFRPMITIRLISNILEARDLSWTARKKTHFSNKGITRPCGPIENRNRRYIIIIMHNKHFDAFACMLGVRAIWLLFKEAIHTMELLPKAKHIWLYYTLCCMKNLQFFSKGA